MRYNAMTGEMEDDNDTYPGSGAPVGSGGPAVASPWPNGIPPNGGNVGGYMDLSYWQSRGVTPDQIFDENGQTRPGWSRTAKGYEKATTPDATTNPYPNGLVDANAPFANGRRPGDPGGGDYGGDNFAWPEFNAPRYTPGPKFQAPPAFSYEAFQAPTGDSIYSDPSYTMRRDEGLQAIEHGAASKGLTRLPSTLKALAGWNQDFASREYGNIFDRAGQTYNTNRNNAADTYSLNYGVSRDTWDRGERQGLDAYDRNYKASYDEFQPKQRQAEQTFDDLYRRWKGELDANTSIASGGYT